MVSQREDEATACYYHYQDSREQNGMTCGWCRFRFRFKFIAGTKGYAIAYID
jgi:hypothetical protein